MPTYQYKCPHCAARFEFLRTVAQQEAVNGNQPCPECRHKAHRVYSGIGLRTNTRYLAGQGRTLLDQFGDTPEGRAQLQKRIETAKKRYGFTPSRHDVYDPTLATAVGHPSGFISHDDPSGHIKRVAANSRVVADPGPPVQIAPDIVDQLVRHETKKNPELAHQDQKKLRDQLIDKHSHAKE